MSVTKLRRYLIGKKENARNSFESDDPNQTEGSETARLIRTTLAAHMARSKRNGSWFRLNKMERGIISLSLRLKVTFESSQLAKALVSVLKKLAEMGDAVYGLMLAGTRMAWAFAEAAVAWGNPAARAWRHDRSYALFLGRSLAGVRGYR